jgi:hypothetical protein
MAPATPTAPGVERLDQEVVRANPARRLHIGRDVVAGHHDPRDGGQGRIRTDPRADRVAVEAGHQDIEQHQVGPDGNGLASTSGPSRAVTTSKPSSRR